MLPRLALQECARAALVKEPMRRTLNRRLMPPRTVTLPPAMRPGWLLARKAFERRAALLGSAGAEGRAATVAPQAAAAQNADLLTSATSGL